MWEFLLATTLTFSASMRAPRVEGVPFDYELAYMVENENENWDLEFRQDFERESGFNYHDIRGKINYDDGHLLVKQDYKQIKSKDLFQFNSDVRYYYHNFSIGGAFIWDLEDFYRLRPSLGYNIDKSLGKWEIETDNDVYFTTPVTYQTDLATTYNINKHLKTGIVTNYIKTVNNFDYAAKWVLVIKFK
jgi:hypothetical protein